jgi:hypothetical protein
VLLVADGDPVFLLMLLLQYLQGCMPCSAHRLPAAVLIELPKELRSIELYWVCDAFAAGFEALQ